MTSDRIKELRGLCEVFGKIQCSKAWQALPELLDAYEASMQREAEKDAEIERVQAENAQIRKDVSALIGEEMAYQEGHIPGDADRVAEIERLKGELAAEKREKDAAVKDLATAKCCDTCKHQNTVYCARRSEWMINCYEWSGPVAAEGEAE